MTNEKKDTPIEKHFFLKDAVWIITQQFDFTKKHLKHFENTSLSWKFRGTPSLE